MNFLICCFFFLQVLYYSTLHWKMHIISYEAIKGVKYSATNTVVIQDQFLLGNGTRDFIMMKLALPRGQF